MKRASMWIAVAAVAAVASARPASAARHAQSRIEMVPAGAEWLLGRGDAAARSWVSGPPKWFAEKHGEGWTMRRSGPSGGFARMWGRGVPVGEESVSDAGAALAAVEAFWEDNAPLLAGATPSDLVPWANRLAGEVRFVSHRQTIRGVPVLGTGVFAAISRGRIVLVGARSFAPGPFDATSRVSPEESEEIARQGLADWGICGEARFLEAALLPLVGDDVVEYRLVHVVDLDAGLGGRWTAHVDAAEGAVLSLIDLRRFLIGATLEVEHYERHPASPLVEGPASYLLIGAGGVATTDVDGSFEASGDSVDVSATLQGVYIEVADHNADNLSFQASDVTDGKTILWTSGVADQESVEFERAQAQLNAFRFASTARERAAALVDDVDWLLGLLPVNVNIDDVDLNEDGVADYCNAWYDGLSINFLVAGDMSAEYRCNNTASIGDIVYHEYGHGFHHYSIIPGVGEFYEDVSEGFADTMASLITHDSVIGPYFLTNGYAIRDMEPDMVWPEDQSEVDPHQTGLILGGAIWDLRKALVAELGEEEGHALTDHIYSQAVKTTADMPSAYEGFLLGDDDNGDLDDGTPNFCIIYDAFEAHGLASETGRIVVVHEQIESAEAGKVIPVEAEVSVAAEECNTLGDVRLVYSTDGGDTTEQMEMEIQGGDLYLAEIPGRPEGSRVWYRIEADEDESGDVIVRPDNPAEPFYEVYVGALREIACDDLEEENDEWTHELVSGEQREGADDWQWATPNGRGGDPPSAYSGEKVWGNDLAPEENWNGHYQGNRINTLRSPLWDASGYDDVHLRFRRWLGVEDGYFDHARLYVDEQLVWENAASAGGEQADHSVHHIDKEWILFDVDITDLIVDKAAFQVRWEIDSDMYLEFGGWTIDDVCLFTSDPPPDPDAGPDGSPDAGEAEIDAMSGGCGCSQVSSGEGRGLLGLFAEAFGDLVLGSVSGAR